MPTIYEQFFKRLGTKIDWAVIDDLVLSDANILRPVKGHAFEIIFDEVANKKLHCQINDYGGDSDIDRVLIDYSGKKYTIQIKTPVTSSIKQGISFAVNLHKTHGLEKRPQNLYPIKWPCPICGKGGHDGESFPDFLIVQHPENGVLIIPKDYIPENKTYPNHFADPVYFNWNNEWLNRWDLLGFPEFKGVTLDRRSISPQTLLPKIAAKVLLSDEEIINMWLKPENFRMIDMNLKGNLREPAFTDLMSKLGVSTTIPKHSYPKYDRITSNGIRVQIKGPSKSLTNITNSEIGSEVMGTHGKGAIRCYSENDFDYLGMVIDPNIIPSGFGLRNNEYHFCLIPVTALPLHYKNSEWHTTNKLYTRCKFKIGKINGRPCLRAYNSYNVNVSFRATGPWYIDEVPANFQ